MTTYGEEQARTPGPRDRWPEPAVHVLHDGRDVTASHVLLLALASSCAMPAMAARPGDARRSDRRRTGREGHTSRPVRAALGREPAVERAQDARRAALGLLSVLRQRLQRRRLHARRRLSPVHRRSHALERRRAVFGEGLQADRGRRDLARALVGPPRSSRHRRCGATPRRWPITGSASTAPPTPTRRFACSRPTSAATSRRGRTGGCCSPPAVAYEDYTLKDPTGDLISGRRRVHARDRARASASIPRTCTRRPSAAFDWRPAADYARRGGLLQGRPPSLRRSRRHLQLRPARRRSRAAHSDPARELGDLAARPAGVDARR